MLLEHMMIAAFWVCLASAVATKAVVAVILLVELVR